MLLRLGIALAGGLLVAASCTRGDEQASAASGGRGGGDDAGARCRRFFGDAAAAMEIEPALLVPGQKIVPLHDGDDADLIRPQQGGHCLFVAARVKNLCEDDVKLEAKILDPSGALLSGPDGKSPVVWVEHDGFLEPEPDNGADMPNVCACPALLEPIADHLVVVEVTATDQVTGRVGTAKVRVTPICAQTNAECKKLCACECGPKGGGFCPRPSDVVCETDP